MDAFTKSVLVEPIYYAESEFHEPFWNFMYRLQSLQRHWEISKDFLNAHIAELLDTPDDGSAEFSDFFSETAWVDIEYFLEYQRLSTISFGLSLVENLLGDLAGEISERLGKPIELDKRKLPYINRYILWLTRECGIEIDIDKELWRQLDVIRELRNRFVHKIGRAIPNEMKRVMSEMVSDISSKDEGITDEFVNASLNSLAQLVKRTELAYVAYYRNADG